jgi:hypothetical protein
MNCSLHKDFLFKKVKHLHSAAVGEKSVELIDQALPVLVPDKHHNRPQPFTRTLYHLLDPGSIVEVNVCCTFR